MGSHAAPRRRRPWLVAGAALVVVAAGVTTVTVQVRAAGEQARTEQAALLDSLDRHWATYGRVYGDRVARADARADAAQAATIAGAVTIAWTAGTATAQTQLAAATALLDETEGEVADDEVRTAVSDAAAAVTDALVVPVASDQAAAGGDATADAPTPEAEHVAALSAATRALTSAMATLSAAHEEWLAAEAARKRAATSHYAGDCGGAASYESPTSTGSNRFYTSVPTEDGDGTNGNIPRSAMTPLSWCVDSAGHEQWLRTDAAAAMVRLNDAFRAEFGENIAIDLSYRSYADQVRAKQLYGGLAATPGTSNHGWGTAIDTWEWDSYDFGSDRYEWLVANGPSYGWYCPAATESGNPEYWHFEFRG